MYKIILASAICIIALLGCKPKQSNSYVTQYLKNNFYYQPGSYWIYKDSVTGNRNDSFAVVSSWISHENMVNINTEVINMHIYEYSNNALFVGWQMTLAGNQIRLCHSTFGSVPLAVDQCYPLIFNSDALNSSSDDGEAISTVNYIGSMTVGGISYDSVFHASILIKSKSYTDHFYTTRKFGIIKIIQRNPLLSRTLDLVRAQIKLN